jgi:predicted nucleic acid-binding protein
LAARAGMIVSGDAHLLDLVDFQGIAIVSAADALARLP